MVLHLTSKLYLKKISLSLCLKYRSLLGVKLGVCCLSVLSQIMSVVNISVIRLRRHYYYLRKQSCFVVACNTFTESPEPVYQHRRAGRGGAIPPWQPSRPHHEAKLSSAAGSQLQAGAGTATRGRPALHRPRRPPGPAPPCPTPALPAAARHRQAAISPPRRSHPGRPQAGGAWPRGAAALRRHRGAGRRPRPRWGEPFLVRPGLEARPGQDPWARCQPGAVLVGPAPPEHLGMRHRRGLCHAQALVSPRRGGWAQLPGAFPGRRTLPRARVGATAAASRPALPGAAALEAEPAAGCGEAAAQRTSAVPLPAASLCGGPRGTAFVWKGRCRRAQL